AAAAAAGDAPSIAGSGLRLTRPPRARVRRALAETYNPRVPAAAPVFTLASGPFAGVPADVLVAFVPEGAGADAQLDALTGAALASLLGGPDLRRKASEPAWLPIAAGQAGKATRVLLVGTGKADDLTPERWRRVAIVAGIAVRQRRFGSLACLLPAGHD